MAQLLNVEIPVAHGHLEGLLRLPDAASATDTMPQPRVALVCHPHPIGGGNMHNKVVFRMAHALGDCGMPVLRFNFRGVGRSTGQYDHGRGEGDDVRAALDYLAATYPDAPICLAGFSFGAAVGLPVGCADDRVRQLVGVGVPQMLFAVDDLVACAKPKLFIQGDQDTYGPPTQLAAWYARVSAPKQLTVVSGADHFFTAYQSQLHDAIVSYFRPQ